MTIGPGAITTVPAAGPVLLDAADYWRLRARMADVQAAEARLAAAEASLAHARAQHAQTWDTLVETYALAPQGGYRCDDATASLLPLTEGAR